jgi:glycerophosphoryl diester phosphodiesterase
MFRKSSFILFLLTIVALVSAEVPHGFDLQAHRGGRDRRPENTLAAFRYAIELGVTTLELDTAVTKDRVVVVSHDPRLNPNLTKDSDGKFISGTTRKFIKELNLAELKTYTVGELKPGTSYYYKHREQIAVPGQRIPALAEVFRLCLESGAEEVRLNIEIKTYPPFPKFTVGVEEFVDLLLAVIGEYKMEQRVSIQSFDWRTLKLVQQKAPEIVIVCLTAGRLSMEQRSYNLQPGRSGASPWLAGLDYDEFSGIAPLVKSFGGDIVSPNYREISKKDVEEAHRLSLKIIPWTVNNEVYMKRLIEWGVDGIITDKPDILKKLLETLE